MARIAGVDIPRDKRVEIALTYIYGIGPTRSVKVLADTNIDKNIRVKDLTDDQLVAIRDYLDGNYKLEGDLRRDVSLNIKHKKDIRCYQGLRHIRKLPVHGQNTHSNARTRKGKRKTVAGKKKAAKK